MVEGLALMRQLWTSKEPFDFHGKYYQSIGGILEPKPVQKPYPPLWFGGTGKSTLKLATQYADSWMPPGGGGGSWKVEQYEPIIKALRTDNKTGRRIKLRFNGSFPEIKANIETFSKMGFDGAFLVRLNYKDSIDGIRKLAKEVIPSYR